MGTKLLTSRKFNWISTCFDDLRIIIDDFIRNEKEPPFFYNETASVSLVVSAASRKGWRALADYSREKNSRGEQQSKTKNGRCDLYIGVSANTYLELEAKQVYVRLSSLARRKSRLTDSLKAARKDAKSLWFGRRGKKAGIVFAVLSLSEAQIRNYTESLLMFEAELRETKAELIWLWFADTKKVWEKCRHEKRYYPALAILING